MGRTVRYLFLAACLALLFTAAARASTPSCTVPARMHLSALVFSYGDDLTPIAKRIAAEGFDAVAKSLPLNYSSDVGWFALAQLAGTQYAPAAALHAGETTRMNPELSPGFVHVDQLIPEMSCDRAIELYPDDVVPRLERAQLEMKSGAYEAATSDYSIAARSTNPRFAQAAQYGLAYVQYREGDYGDALTDVDAAIASQGGDAYTLKALIEEAMGDDDLATADAARGFDQYRGNLEDAWAATYALAEAYSDLGYFAASDDELHAVLKQHPRYALVLVALAFNEFSTGDVGGATRDFTAAAKADPSMEQPYLGLAMLAYAQGNSASAQRYAQQAYTLFPHDVYTKLWVLITAGRAPRRPPGLKPCEPGFYAGIYALQHGLKQQGDAMLRAAAQACPYRDYERAEALQLLKAQR